MKCKDIDTVRAFCDCIPDEDNVDEAVQIFCQRVATGGDPYVTGAGLAEVKEALMNPED